MMVGFVMGRGGCGRWRGTCSAPSRMHQAVNTGALLADGGRLGVQGECRWEANRSPRGDPQVPEASPKIGPGLGTAWHWTPLLSPLFTAKLAHRVGWPVHATERGTPEEIQQKEVPLRGQLAASGYCKVLAVAVRSI